MNKERNIKVAAIIITVLLFGAFTGVAMLTSANRGLHKNLNAEKLRTENLLSEKLQLDKQLKDFKEQVNRMEGKNKDLDKYLSETRNKLTEQESAVFRLTSENTNLKTIRKEKEKLQQLKNELYTQIESLTKDNQALKDQLQESNLTIAQLKEENKKLLSSSISVDGQAQLPLASNLRIEVRKKNEEKLTVRAKRTHSLLLTFDLPKSSAMTLGSNYQVQMLSLQGKAVAGQMKALTTTHLDGTTASLAGHPAAHEYEQVSMVYEPNERMEKGIYTLVIYNGNVLVGSAQVKLSK